MHLLLITFVLAVCVRTQAMQQNLDDYKPFFVSLPEKVAQQAAHEELINELISSADNVPLAVVYLYLW